jgi:hypothetical protein
LECGDLSPLWSPATCRRISFARLKSRVIGEVLVFKEVRDRSQTGKALTGQRTPKKSLSLILQNRFGVDG